MSAAVRAAFAAARRQGLRAKDAAAAIGLSEGAAVAAHQGAHGEPLRARALHGPWVTLLQGLEACGELMALTRNEAVVHEKTGCYVNVTGGDAIGLALGEAIDLRLFFDRWHAGFAVEEAAADAGKPPLASLQFYDRHGTAVHKVFQRPGSDAAAWAALVERFAAPGPAPDFAPPAAPEPPRPDAEIDAAGLREAWAAMTDTHQFFGLLKRFGAERQQAFRLVEGRFSERVPASTARTLLDAAAADGTAIMVFVGSPGCIQIHTGPVARIVPLERGGARWLNVLDPGFSLHLREDMVDTAWVVAKPTDDGTVTSVELFDPAGTLMAMFFGARKPGQPELPAWRALVAGLPRA
ncbi:hemin-degrading factor [Pseudorhodoferax sp.]|uniref:hemin-degrading factor n=1 Tax=Pseudorhodoferax sp. TaxID=1993553 RepID=UPI0039E46563